MKALLTLIRQDLLLSWRNGLILSTLVLLVIMGALIYLLPTDIDPPVAQIVYDSSSDQRFERHLRAGAAADFQFVESEAALEAALDELGRGFGVVYSEPNGDPAIRLLTVGALSAENVNVAGAGLDLAVATMLGRPAPAGYAIEMLRARSAPIPLNLNFIPVAIVFEVVLLGFLFGAVMVFEEKQEGVNRALRVSPLTTGAYIWAKNLLFNSFALLYGGVLIFLALRLEADYARVLLLVLLTTSLMTFAGLAIAVFFNSLSEWFFAGVGVLLFFNLPLLPYALPQFMPPWITWIPSFPVLFGVREVLFPTGQSGFYLPLVGQMLVYNGLAYLLCRLAVDRRLMKAG